MFLDPAKIPHSRAYRVRTSVLMVLAGSQTDCIGHIPAQSLAWAFATWNVVGDFWAREMA